MSWLKILSRRYKGLTSKWKLCIDVRRASPCSAARVAYLVSPALIPCVKEAWVQFSVTPFLVLPAVSSFMLQLLCSLAQLLSHVWFFCDPVDCTYQAPLSVGFSRQKYWSGLPFPSPGDLPDPGIEPESPAWQAGPLPSEPPERPPTVIYWAPNIGQGLWCVLAGKLWVSQRTVSVHGALPFTCLCIPCVTSNTFNRVRWQSLSL